MPYAKQRTSNRYATIKLHARCRGCDQQAKEQSSSYPCNPSYSTRPLIKTQDMRVRTQRQTQVRTRHTQDTQMKIRTRTGTRGGAHTSECVHAERLIKSIVLGSFLQSLNRHSERATASWDCDMGLALHPLPVVCPCAHTCFTRMAVARLLCYHGQQCCHASVSRMHGAFCLSRGLSASPSLRSTIMLRFPCRIHCLLCSIYPQHMAYIYMGRV